MKSDFETWWDLVSPVLDTERPHEEVAKAGWDAALADEKLAQQTSALQSVVTWLEANGHDAENRKLYNGELHRGCYACFVLDKCKAALLNNEIIKESEAKG